MTTGSWVKKEDLQNAKTVEIVSETMPQPSQFKNKDGSPKNQDVCKIMLEGKDEAVNIGLNKATINGLIDAFGTDSTKWENKPLAVELEKVRVSGVLRTAVYLIPEGFERIDDEKGYAMIVRKDSAVKSNGQKKTPATSSDDIPVVEEEEGEIGIDKVPF